MALVQDELSLLQPARPARLRLAPLERTDGDVDTDGDRRLVQLCQDGDAGAFDELYRRYHRRLYRLCKRRLANAQDAEDAAQEAFVRAWRALPSLRGERLFYPWLRVIALRVCADTGRRMRNRRWLPLEEAGNHAVEGAGEQDALRRADADLLAQAVARLSERHRRVLDLRERQGMSYQQIADHQGLSASAVETLLWRARQSLRREFLALEGAIEGDTSGALAGVPVIGAVVRALSALRGRLALRDRAAQLAGGPIGPILGNALAAAVLGTTIALPGILGHPGAQPLGSGQGAVLSVHGVAPPVASASPGAPQAQQGPPGVGSLLPPSSPPPPQGLHGIQVTSAQEAGEKAKSQPVHLTIPGTAVGIDPSQVHHYVAWAEGDVGSATRRLP